MLGAMLLLIGNRRLDFVSRQMLRQAFVAALFLLATHMRRDDGLLLLEARLVDCLGQALGRVGRVVAEINQQLIRVAQIAFATTGKRPLDQQLDLQLKFFLFLFEFFDFELKLLALAVQFVDRVRLGLDQTGLLVEHAGLLFEQRLARRQVVGNRFCVGPPSHARQHNSVFKSRKTHCEIF